MKRKRAQEKRKRQKIKKNEEKIRKLKKEEGKEVSRKLGRKHIIGKQLIQTTKRLPHQSSQG